MGDDDIVTRLREGHGQGCTCYARCYCECGCGSVWAERYINEAADEIERLRAEVALLKDARQRQRDIVDVFLELTEDQEMDTASMLMLHRAAGRPDDWERNIYDTTAWMEREVMTARKWFYPDA